VTWLRAGSPPVLTIEGDAGGVASIAHARIPTIRPR
jgi:hypothetical protein